MKIAQIVCVFPPYKGGIGNIAYQHAHILKKNNIDITTFTPNYNQENSKESQGKKVIKIKTFFKYGKGAILFLLIKKIKLYDTIYFHYPFFGTDIIIWLIKILYPKKKLIIHYHMDVEQYSLVTKILSLPSNIIKKSLFKKTEKIICASLDYVENCNISKYYKKNKNKFIEIPFGVDINNFYPDKNKKLTGQKNILFVGGLDKAHYFKGVHILLQAVSKINPQLNWSLNIVGKGELKNNYKNQAKILGIEEKINFLDNVDNKELKKIYRESHIFVLPSINKGEAFGIVLLEAMSSGLAVIASNLPGVRKVFENNISGLLFKIGDVENLKEKLEKLLINKEELNKISINARKLVEEKYNWRKINKKLVSQFNL